MTERSGRPGFAPNAEVYDDAYYAAMYRPHWFLRNERKYRERDEALLRAVRPHAVDVSSGVESSPGVKDPRLIRAFVAAVRATERYATHGERHV